MKIIYFELFKPQIFLLASLKVTCAGAGQKVGVNASPLLWSAVLAQTLIIAAEAL